MSNYKQYNDEILTQIIGSSAEDANIAFDCVYEKYSSKLKAFCSFKTNTKEESEELFEDAWLKYIEFARSGKSVQNILSFLYTIAKNISVDNFRKKNSVKQIKIEYTNEIDIIAKVMDNQFSVDFENKEMISIIKTVLDGMKDIYKEAFVMQWFGEMSYKEIAEHFSISPENAKMRCHRAMQELIKIMKPYYADEIK